MIQLIERTGITTNPADIHIGGIRLVDVPNVAELLLVEQEAEFNEVLFMIQRNGLFTGLMDKLQVPTLQTYRMAFEGHSFNYAVLQSLGITDEYTRQQFTTVNKNTIEGYILFIKTHNQDKARFFLNWLDAHIKETDRQAHTYIVAGSRSGKSELIKILLHNYIKKGFASLVVLDPAGKLAKEVAEFTEFTQLENAKKLVYFDPIAGHKNGVYPVLNPFEFAYKDLLKLDRATDELTRAINQILSDASNGFTDQMALIVKRMIAVLLYKGNCSFWDLLRFLNPEQNTDLIQIGKEHPNQAVKDFFTYRYGIDKDLNVSLGGIKIRVESLVSNTTFMRSTTGKSTINLESVLDYGKYLICNLSIGNLGEHVSKAIGKLIVAQIQILSLQRQEKDPRTYKPVHVFIDEMQNYITQSIEQILTQSAKYKVYLTLANQYTGQSDRSTGVNQFYTALLGNTWVKIIGKAGYDTISDMNKEMNVGKDELSKLQKGKFYVRVGSNTPFLLTASKRLLDNKNSMNFDEWEKLQAEQLRQYYRHPTQYAAYKPTTQIRKEPEPIVPTVHTLQQPQKNIDTQTESINPPYTVPQSIESNKTQPQTNESPRKKIVPKFDL